MLSSFNFPLYFFQIVVTVRLLQVAVDMLFAMGIFIVRVTARYVPLELCLYSWLRGDQTWVLIDKLAPLYAQMQSPIELTAPVQLFHLLHF